MKRLLYFTIRMLIARAIFRPRRKRRAVVKPRPCRSCRGTGRVYYRGKSVQGYRPCHTCHNMSGLASPNPRSPNMIHRYLIDAAELFAVMGCMAIFAVAFYILIGGN